MAGPHLNVLQAGRRSLAVIQDNPRGTAGMESRLMESLGCMGGCGACPNRMGCGGGKPSELAGSPRITASMLDSLAPPTGSQNEQRPLPTPPKEAAAVKGAEAPPLILPQGAEMSVLSWLAETELRKQKSGIRYSCELFLKNDAPSLERQDTRPRAQRAGRAPMREEEKRPDAPAGAQGCASRLLDIPPARTDSPSPVWSAFPSDIRHCLPPKDTPAACQFAIARVCGFLLRDAAAPPQEKARPSTSASAVLPPVNSGLALARDAAPPDASRAAPLPERRKPAVVEMTAEAAASRVPVTRSSSRRTVVRKMIAVAAKGHPAGSHIRPPSGRSQKPEPVRERRPDAIESKMPIRPSPKPVRDETASRGRGPDGTTKAKDSRIGKNGVAAPGHPSGKKASPVRSIPLKKPPRADKERISGLLISLKESVARRRRKSRRAFR